MLRIKEYIRPQSLEEAYQLCQKKGSVVLGGMLWLKMQNRNVNLAIDLQSLGLDTIEETAEEFRIGSADPIIDPTIAFPAMTDVIAGQKLNVYSGPDISYWRGANGKALVNTNGGLYAAGWVDNDWLLVQYGTSAGNRRTGYVSAAHIKDNFSLLPQLNFAAIPAVITAECVLTDDPENYSDQIVTLAPGTQVTWLADYAGYEGGEPLHYIETKAGSKKVRGFIPMGSLEK